MGADGVEVGGLEGVGIQGIFVGAGLQPFAAVFAVAHQGVEGGEVEVEGAGADDISGHEFVHGGVHKDGAFFVGGVQGFAQQGESPVEVEDVVGFVGLGFGVESDGLVDFAVAFAQGSGGEGFGHGLVAGADGAPHQRGGADGFGRDDGGFGRGQRRQDFLLWRQRAGEFVESVAHFHRGGFGAL